MFLWRLFMFQFAVVFLFLLSFSIVPMAARATRASLKD